MKFLSERCVLCVALHNRGTYSMSDYPLIWWNEVVTRFKQLKHLLVTCNWKWHWKLMTILEITLFIFILSNTYVHFFDCCCVTRSRM